MAGTIYIREAMFPTLDAAQIERARTHGRVGRATGVLFPEIAEDGTNDRGACALLSGAKSYPFLGLITRELARLLPSIRRCGTPNVVAASRRMRKDVEAFLLRSGVQ
jgi:hypothetical protein